MEDVLVFCVEELPTWVFLRHKVVKTLKRKLCRARYQQTQSSCAVCVKKQKREDGWLLQPFLSCSVTRTQNKPLTEEAKVVEDSEKQEFRDLLTHQNKDQELQKEFSTQDLLNSSGAWKNLVVWILFFAWPAQFSANNARMSHETV
jgi:hypothetical protein